MEAYLFSLAHGISELMEKVTNCTERGSETKLCGSVYGSQDIGF